MKTKLTLFALLLAFLFNSQLSCAQSVSINILQDMCDADGSAEVVLEGIPEPVTVSWHNQDLDEYYSGLNPTNLKDGYYEVQVLDADGNTHIAWTYINAQVQWTYNTWDLEPATCPGGTAQVEMEIFSGTAGFDIYINDELDGSTETSNYLTSALPIGSNPTYVVDELGCRSSYAIEAQDSSAIEIWGVTNLGYELNAVELECGMFEVSAELVTPTTGPYNNHWSYWSNGEMVEVYGQDVITVPSQTSVWYNAEDADGCTATFWEYVFSQTAMQAWASVSPAVCPNDDGAIDLNVSGGTSPYSYEWNTGATSASISGLEYGSYTVLITDADDCTHEFTRVVPQSSDLQVTGISSPPNCEGSTTGFIDVTAQNGSEPYSYSWSTDETSEDIEISDFGYYYVSVTDADGCSGGRSFWVPISDPCYSYVTGTTYYDLNGNCTADSEDFSIDANVSGLNGDAYYTESGEGTYTRRFLEDIWLVTQESGYDVNCPDVPVELEFVPNEVYEDVDFYLEPQTLNNNLGVQVWGANPVPGFDGDAHIFVYNYGTTAIDASVTLEYSTLINYSSSTPAPSSVDVENGLVTWELGTIFPLNSGITIDFEFNTPADVELLGEEVTFTATLGEIPDDIDLGNNSSTAVRTVIGAYDPNDKQAIPSGEGTNNRIDPETDELIYKIRFQNTGTAPAVNVVIEDEIDPNTLDIQSIEVLSTSHELSDVMTQGDKVSFAFQNIFLPDSVADLEGSQGYINFKIDVLDDLSLGTVIENDAAIFFDFNPPIITNNAFVTLDEENSVTELVQSAVQIYPNPTSGFLLIETDVEQGLFELSDLSGRIVFTANLGASSTQVNLPEHLSEGLYTGRVIENQKVIAVQKILLAK